MYFKRKLICTMGSVTSVVLLTHILNKRAVGLPVADPEPVSYTHLTLPTNREV